MIRAATVAAPSARSRIIRYAVDVGERRELYCSAMGKISLAWLDPFRQRQYLASIKLRRFTPTTIVSITKLRDEIARIRREGMSRSNGERVHHADAIAAPIFARGGRSSARCSSQGRRNG